MSDYVYSSMSKASRLIDRLDAVRDLFWDVKSSSDDVDHEVESLLDKLEEVFRSELEIKEQALFQHARNILTSD